MAVKQSYAMVNGVKMLAIYDSATQLWTVEGNAPADSSWSQPNHVYKIELSVQDNDGNTSTTAVVNFVISTTAPTLNVETPVDNILTNKTSVTVSGTAAPGSDAVTLAEVTINGEKVDVGEGGAFSKVVTGLSEGDNNIVIIAKDNLGKTTTVNRKVRVDTKAPVISDVVAQSTTVDAGGRIKITFKVVDPA